MLFKTILDASEYTYTIEKSRFIVYMNAVQNEIEAQRFIESIRKKHYAASHNVPIYRLGNKGEVQKFSDDGEPAGTSGFPVLEMLKKENISNICVVITRYFGGIKLGTGGLMRAYTTAVKEAVQNTTLYEVNEYTLGSVQIEYPWIGNTMHLIEQMDIKILESDYTDLVAMKVLTLPEQWPNFVDQIAEITAGQGICQVGDETLALLKGNHIMLY